MKILLLLTTLLIGCSQPPNFTKPVHVQSKESWIGGAKYTLKSNQGTRGSGVGTVEFYAPDGFANVGDTIIFKDGVLKVKNEEE